MRNRRLGLVAVLLAGGVGSGAAGGATYVYVSNAQDGDISMFRMDEQTGRLAGGDRVQAASMVMPMSVSPDRRHLYAAAGSRPYRVFSYPIDPANGQLLRPVVAALPASMPYISTDRTGRYLFGASYDADLVSVSRIDADGRVHGDAIQVIPTGRKAHSIGVDRTNRFAFAANLGSGQIVQWRFDARTGRLAPNTPSTVNLGAAAGPRHFVVSPDNRFVYMLDEHAASVTSLSLDADTGLLSEAGEAAALPAGTNALGGSPTATTVAGEPDRGMWAADLHLTPDGRFLYATERRTSTLTTFKVDPKTGRLARRGSQPTEAQPRGFAIDPRGAFLIVAGEKSPTLSV